MIPLNNKYIYVLAGLLVLGMSACAPQRLTPQYETPPPDLRLEDNRLYFKALDAQNRGKLGEAEELWEVFLKRYPDSVQALNNLGRVYYLNDKLSQAVQQFEKGLALEPGDKRLRQNLSDALKLEANLLYEDKRYDATIQKLRRLKEIAPVDEKQDIQIRIEKVEDEIFNQVRQADTAEAYRSFLEKYPEGINAQRARKRLKEIEAQSGTLEAPSGMSALVPHVETEPEKTEMEKTEPAGKQVTAPVPAPQKKKMTPPQPVAPQKDEMAILEQTFTDETLDETIVEEPGPQSAGTQPPAGGKKETVFNTEQFGEGGEPVQIEPDSPELASTGPEPAESQAPEKLYGSDVSDQALDEFLKSLDTEELEVQPEKPDTAVFPEDKPPAPEKIEPLTQQAPQVESGPTTPPGDMKMIAPFEALADQEEPVSQFPVDPQTAPAGSKPKPEAVTKLAEQPVVQKTAPIKKKTDKHPSAPVKKQTAAKKQPSSGTHPPVEPPPGRRVEETPHKAEAFGSRTLVRVEIDSGHLNVRSEPSVKTGAIVGKLKRGDTVPLVKETRLWFQVEYKKGKHGWISRDYARKLPPALHNERFGPFHEPVIAAA